MKNTSLTPMNELLDAIHGKRSTKGGIQMTFVSTDKMNKLFDAIHGEAPTMGGVQVPYIPTPISCWSNPLDEYKNTRKKSAALLRARENNEMAIDSHGNEKPVKDFKINQLAFVGGLWRIQEELPLPITRIRDKDMILTKKIDHTETTLFEFFRGKEVKYNCYGPFVIQDDKYDYIVAKYETDKKTYWSYGKSIEQARAFMGIKMYDEYKDVINTIACKNKLRGGK
ncbi:MAG: hypothetical protein IKP05_04025 [Alphaproteobacteria bacterium]|nr:hypothetical protein [Alphaproteobacteria bacterium]